MGTIVSLSLRIDIRLGARVDAKANNGLSPLHSAACSGSAECVDLLVQFGEFVNVVDTEGVSPLHQVQMLSLSRSRILYASIGLFPWKPRMCP